MGQRDLLRGFFSAQHQRNFFRLARQFLDGSTRLGANFPHHYLGVCPVGQQVGTTGTKRLGCAMNCQAPFRIAPECAAKLHAAARLAVAPTPQLLQASEDSLRTNQSWD